MHSGNSTGLLAIRPYPWAGGEFSRDLYIQSLTWRRGIATINAPNPPMRHRSRMLKPAAVAFSRCATNRLFRTTWDALDDSPFLFRDTVSYALTWYILWGVIMTPFLSLGALICVT